MKASLSILALAASALAANIPRWSKDKTQTLTTYTTVTTCPVTTTTTQKGTTKEITTYTTSTKTITSCIGGCGEGGVPGATVTVPGPVETKGTTTAVLVTYTTICPVTETVTGKGTTYVQTRTTTSTVVTVVPTHIIYTVPGPVVTKSAETVQYVTSTSLCPITETKTIGGSTICVTWTSTSTIVKPVPTTVDVYTTQITTIHATTEVYSTTTCPVTTYTTVVQGSTIVVTETRTKWLTLTSAYTVTEVIPVTQTKEVDVTIQTTLGQGQTLTQHPTVVVTIGSTAVQTVAPPPTTVVQPTTRTTTAATAPTTVATAGADYKAKAPAAAFLAGLVGAIALI